LLVTFLGFKRGIFFVRSSDLCLLDVGTRTATGIDVGNIVELLLSTEAAICDINPLLFNPLEFVNISSSGKILVGGDVGTVGFGGSSSKEIIPLQLLYYIN